MKRMQHPEDYFTSIKYKLQCKLCPNAASEHLTLLALNSTRLPIVTNVNPRVKPRVNPEYRAIVSRNNFRLTQKLITS